MTAAALMANPRRLQPPPAGSARPLPDVCALTWKLGKAWAAVPFDALRAQYAEAVRCGMLERSMLASRDFERTVHALERLSLGPLARRV
jgi:hypothetical protein